MATEIKIPDIGDFKDIPIIEVHVKEGDPINVDGPLVSLESDEATIDVPAPELCSPHHKPHSLECRRITA